MLTCNHADRMACARGHADGMWMSALSLFTLDIKEWAVIKRRDPPWPQSNWLFQHFISESACARARKPTCMFLSKSVLKWTPPQPLLPSHQGALGSALVGIGSETLQVSFFFIYFYEHINIQAGSLSVSSDWAHRELRSSVGNGLKMAWMCCRPTPNTGFVSFRCTLRFAELHHLEDLQIMCSTFKCSDWFARVEPCSN